MNVAEWQLNAARDRNEYAVTKKRAQLSLSPSIFNRTQFLRNELDRHCRAAVERFTHTVACRTREFGFAVTVRRDRAGGEPTRHERIAHDRSPAIGEPHIVGRRTG